MSDKIKFDFCYKNKATIELEDFDLLRESSSIENKNYEFEKKHNKRAQRRFYAITKGGKFDIGLFFFIKKQILKVGLTGMLEYSEEFKKRCVPKYNIDKLSTLKFEPRDYQEEAVRNMLKYGRGVCHIGTGGGKTFIMALFTKTVIDNHSDSTFFIIVPTLQLVEQTYFDFLEYGFTEKDISKWSGDNKFNNTRIIVANVGILDKNTENKKNIFNRSVLIVDEAHILKKENEINNFINKFETPRRFGFTGTMPEEVVDRMNVCGKIGKIIYQKKGKSLRDDGFISNLKINIIRVTYNDKSYDELERVTDEYNEDRYVKNRFIPEIDFLIHHKYRNSIIAKLANKDKNVLVLVDRVEHGEILLEELKKTNKECSFIHGGVDVKIRETIRDMMEKQDNIICIAMTKVFSTGINIKNLNYIIFATAGKAKVKIIQSIGRGLRLHKNKKKLVVYDVADDTRYGLSHLNKRKKLYNEEGIAYTTYAIKEK